MDRRTVQLTAAQQAALDLVKRHQGFTAAELAHIAGKDNSARRLDGVLRVLVNKGLLAYGNDRWCCRSAAISKTYVLKGVKS